MSDLPDGWQWAKFDDVAGIASDLVDPAAWQHAQHIAPNHIEPRTGRLSGVSTVAADGITSPNHRFRPGQVLYSKIRPYLAKATLAPYSGLCSADMYPIDSRIDNRYLLYWMLSDDFTNFAAAHQGRSVLPKINQAALKTLPVPVAPLEEQQRIVAAIEEAVSKLDAGQAGLRIVHQLLRRLRNSVLASAVDGTLVRQEPRDAPAESVFAALGIEPLQTENLRKLPSGWAWARVEQIGSIDLGRQRHPDWHSGPNMKPYLRVANVFEDRIDTSDLMQMHFDPDVFERFRVRVGDVLLNEGQTPELLGRPAIYRGNPPEVAFTNSILRFRACEAVSPDWALVVFRHYMRAGRFTRESRITTNIAHLSASRLKSIEFPVPPLKEQLRIVSEVDRQESFIVAAEQATDVGLRRSAALRRSVFKSAFEGRLAPQDPSDTPAGVLLEQLARRSDVPQRRTQRGAGQR